MKKLAIILSLILAVCIKASAQDALYVVDGQPSNVNVKPADIISVTIVDSSKMAALNFKPYKYGMTVIVTRQGAIVKYQIKFSALNKKYKEYIDQKHNDSNLAYVLNNTILNMDKKSSIEALYELKPEDIKSINFKRDSHFTTDATVIITTKE